MAYLSRNDFIDIGDIANHCDLNKLSIAINEASEFDLDELFCGFWSDILDNWDSEDENWINLLNGGEYEGCNGTRNHKGIKRIWAYYAYSRYIILNGFNDTPNGMVAKTNNFSIPTPLKELQAYADKYRNMGKLSFEKTQAYLCNAKEFFVNFNDYKCAPCGCVGECNKSKTNTKGYGLRSNIVKKKI